MLAGKMLRSAGLAAVGLALVLACLAAPAVAKAPLPPEMNTKIHDYVAGGLAELKVPGAAVVTVGPEGIEYEEGFGITGPGGSPVTPQTPFHVASLSKELTAIAVMQLIQSGDLELEATVHSYLPWFGAANSPTALITIHDLLAHTSGWSESDGLTNRIDEATDDGALERNVRRLARIPPSHPIGQFEYSDGNYNVLGYLVAVRSGVSYEAYMAEHVFAPLQMTHTYTSDSAARAGGLAQGHYPFFGIPIPYDVPFARGSVPGSFIASSAEDLGHVLIAHLNDGQYGGERVLPPGAMAQLRTPLVHPDAWDGYGWGWWSYPLWDAGHLVDAAGGSDYEVPVVVEHVGLDSTYAAGMLLLPEEGIGVAIVMNLDDRAAPSRFTQIHLGIAQILLGREPGPLIAREDLLMQNAKLLLAGAVIAMALGVPWGLRRIRRWWHDPASAPRGRSGLLRGVVLPLTVDLGVTALAWWFVLDRSPAKDIPVIVRFAPDIALSLAAIAVLGIGWGLLRTALTLHTMRLPRGQPTGAEPI
jgi:CubicO group peptidase (beta-lactamase class C family)